MENSKVTVSPEEAFNNKKLFSNKIHSRVLKVVEGILKSIEKIQIENDEDKRLFLNAVNHYYRDLYTIVFHLRQVVIKIGDLDEGVQDLQNVIDGLNKIVLHLQESLRLEIEEFKTQLKSTITDVGTQVENLMKIMEYDNLHEHKQDVLDCQHDLVISAEALKLYCQFCYQSPSELENLVHEVLQKIKSNLIEIQTDHAHMEEDFAHYTRHSVKHLANTLNYSRKLYNTEKFSKDVLEVFEKSDVLAIELMNELLDAVRYDNPINKMIDIIENGHDKVRKASGEVQKGVLIAIAKNTGGKDHETVKQLMIHLFINCVNGLSAINLSIEDAVMRK